MPERLNDSELRSEVNFRKWLLPFLLLIGLVVFAEFLLGQKLFIFTDIGSDTSIIFYADYYHMANYLRDHGLPGWSHEQGLGQDLLPFSLGDPINWLLYLAGGKYLHLLLPWLMLARLILAGYFFARFLRLLGFEAFYQLFGAGSFAFSGFALLGSTWYIFATEIWHFALLLYGLELLHQNWGKPHGSAHGSAHGKDRDKAPVKVRTMTLSNPLLVLPLATCLIALNQPFNLYPMGLLGGIYVLLRRGWNGRDGMGLNLGQVTLVGFGLGLLGLGLSALLAFPQISELLNSPRGSGMVPNELLHQKVLKPAPVLLLKSFVARLFGNDLYGSGFHFMGWQNYLEAPATYIGLPALLFLPQLFPGLSRGRRILVISLAALLLATVVFPYFRQALWGFTGDYFRLLNLLYTVPLLLGGLEGLRRFHNDYGPWRIKLLVLTGCLLIALLLPDFYKYPGVHHKGLQLLLIACIILYLLSATNRKLAGKPQLKQSVLLLLLAVELIGVGRPTLHRRDTVAPAGFFSQGYFDASLEKIAQLKDGSFFRLSRATHAGYTPNVSLNDAKVQAYAGDCSYRSFNQLGYVQFLNTVGVIDANRESETRWISGLNDHPFLGSLLGIRHHLDSMGVVHENELAMPIGIFHEVALNEAAFLEMEPLQRQALLWQGYISKSAPPPVNSYSSMLPSSAELLEPNWYARQRKQLMQSQLKDLIVEENSLSANIDVDREGMLVFSIPYDQGWQASINGSGVEIELVNDGLIGVPIEAGKHEISLQFRSPYFRLGIAVSLLSVGVLALLLLRYRRQFD